MTVRDAKARFSEAISAAQGGYVLVTRHGRPAAVLIGVDGDDAVDVVKKFDQFDRA